MDPCLKQLQKKIMKDDSAVHLDERSDSNYCSCRDTKRYRHEIYLYFIFLHCNN